MRVLIFGLPGSGKTYLAERLVEYLGDKVAWFNADKVREEANDWDFSEEGRLRQNQRMLSLCENAEAEGKIAIADFVAPFEKDFKNLSFNPRGAHYKLPFGNLSISRSRSNNP